MTWRWTVAELKMSKTWAQSFLRMVQETTIMQKSLSFTKLKSRAMEKIRMSCTFLLSMSLSCRRQLISNGFLKEELKKSRTL
jgi:hypothetical protein